MHSNTTPWPQKKKIHARLTSQGLPTDQTMDDVIQSYGAILETYYAVIMLFSVLMLILFFQHFFPVTSSVSTWHLLVDTFHFHTNTNNTRK